MFALVLAIESLGQISVLRTGRPRHTTRRRKGTLDSGSVISHKIFRFSILRRGSSDFLLNDSSRIHAVKYGRRYANLHTTSQVHTLQYWDCICIRASETRWGTANKERSCHTPKGTERINSARYMYRFCQNGQQLHGNWLRWGTWFSLPLI
jgi:hypothetical protein